MKKNALFKICKHAVLAIIFFGTTTTMVFADTTIGALASNVTQSFESVVNLMIAVSYLLGIGFAGAAIFKFKQHKDNPTQIPIGTPIALLVIGILLIFLPGIIGPIGTTIFGSSGTQISGGPQGSAAALPGTSGQ
jgi:hypothetical protein